jgi:hypothetical protein
VYSNAASHSLSLACGGIRLLGEAGGLA